MQADTSTASRHRGERASIDTIETDKLWPQDMVEKAATFIRSDIKAIARIFDGQVPLLLLVWYTI